MFMPTGRDENAVETDGTECYTFVSIFFCRSESGNKCRNHENVNENRECQKQIRTEYGTDTDTKAEDGYARLHNYTYSIKGEGWRDYGIKKYNWL